MLSTSLRGKFMTPSDLSKDSVRITQLIDSLLWSFPEASPRMIAQILTQRLYPNEPLENHLQEVKVQYSNMISVRKSQLKKWRACKTYGRPLKALQVAHRVEWMVGEEERGLAADLLVRVKAVAEKCRPRVEDVKPFGVWYVIPNRNRQLEYHDEFVSVRIMPQSGTVRILPAVEMDYNKFENRVWDAFWKAELPMKECDRVVQTLRVRDEHRVFHVGPVTPFKIDFYKDSLGLGLRADGSHPDHIESHEGWPTWVQPLIRSTGRQIEANEKQTAAITALTEQITLHLAVMAGIEKATLKLSAAADKLYKFAKADRAHKKEKEEKSQRKLTEY